MNQNQNQNQHHHPIAVDYAEAARILQINESTLRGLVQRGVIPHVRISQRIVRFRIADLHEWLAQRTVTPAEVAQ